MWPVFRIEVSLFWRDHLATFAKLARWRFPAPCFEFVESHIPEHHGLWVPFATSSNRSVSGPMAMCASYLVPMVSDGISIVKYEEIVVPNTHDAFMVEKWPLFRFALNFVPKFPLVHAV